MVDCCIDRVQSAGGVHIGISVGDLELVPIRPFDLAHIGFVGDSINLAARLQAVAGPSEIVVSNRFHHQLPLLLQSGFEELQPVDAKNLGTVRCWRWSPAAGAPLMASLPA